MRRAFLLTGAVAGGLGAWYSLGRVEVLVEQHETKIPTMVTREEYQQHIMTQAEQYRQIRAALNRIEDRLNGR